MIGADKEKTRRPLSRLLGLSGGRARSWHADDADREQDQSA